MTTYFAEAGVPVADEHGAPDRDPQGPAVLADIATRSGIHFRAGT